MSQVLVAEIKTEPPKLSTHDNCVNSDSMEYRKKYCTIQMEEEAQTIKTDISQVLVAEIKNEPELLIHDHCVNSYSMEFKEDATAAKENNTGGGGAECSIGSGANESTYNSLITGGYNGPLDEIQQQLRSGNNFELAGNEQMDADAQVKKKIKMEEDDAVASGAAMVNCNAVGEVNNTNGGGACSSNIELGHISGGPSKNQMDAQEMTKMKMQWNAEVALRAAMVNVNTAAAEGNIASDGGGSAINAAEGSNCGGPSNNQMDAQEMTKMKMQRNAEVASRAAMVNPKAAAAVAEEYIAIASVGSAINAAEGSNCGGATAENEKNWRDSVTTELRLHLVHKVVVGLFPMDTAPGVYDPRLRNLVEFAQGVEKEKFQMAKSRSEYYHLLATKIINLKMGLAKKRKHRDMLNEQKRAQLYEDQRTLFNEQQRALLNAQQRALFYEQQCNRAVEQLNEQFRAQQQLLFGPPNISGGFGLPSAQQQSMVVQNPVVSPLTAAAPYATISYAEATTNDSINQGDDFDFGGGW